MEKDSNLHQFLTIGVFVLLVILIFNSFFVFSMGSKLDEKINEAKELAKPAKIEVIKLESLCENCFTVDEILTVLKESSDLEITKETSLKKGSKEAIDMINQYNIEKLPTVILKGEITKVSIQNFEENNEALVFNGVSPPYENAKTNNIVGKVSTIIINDKNCGDKCADFSLSIDNLKNSGVFISKEVVYDYSDAKAKEIIGKFGIRKLPAVLLSRDIEIYTDIVQSISQLASKRNNYYLIESAAPYVEASTGKIRGLVDLTLIEDAACEECYDVEIHKQILARFGMAMNKENKVDISSAEGKALVEKYAIKKVPTVVISGDLREYEGFDTVWGQVGSIEEDGTYVFRQLEVLSQNIVYKDLTTGEVVGNTNIQSQ